MKPKRVVGASVVMGLMVGLVAILSLAVQGSQAQEPEPGGAVLGQDEVQYRVGETITRTKLVDLDTLLISTGKIIEVPKRSIRACRTQIVTEVRDAAKMVANWSSVLETEHAMTLLHRVLFYGDHADNVRDLAHLMGLKVLIEGTEVYSAPPDLQQS